MPCPSLAEKAQTTGAIYFGVTILIQPEENNVKTAVSLGFDLVMHFSQKKTCSRVGGVSFRGPSKWTGKKSSLCY